MWSLGCLYYEMVVGSVPFEKKINLVQNKIIDEDYRIPEIPKNINLTRLGKLFIEKCLQKELEERFTIEELIQDPYITQNLFSKPK